MIARRRPAESQCRLFACVAGLLVPCNRIKGNLSALRPAAIAVSQTRAEVRLINEAVRARLRRAGVLSASESTWKLSNKSTSAVDDNYLPKYRSEPGAIRVN